MGVDLHIITGHHLSYEEIIRLQSRIESDARLHSLYQWKNNNYQITSWDSIASKERLEHSWAHNEERKEVNGVFFYDDLYFPTFFGDIKFHRNIVELNGFGQKLWTLENKSDLRESILKFNFRMAEILNQKKAIYFGDSWAKSSWILDCLFDRTIEQIEKKILALDQDNNHNIETSIKEKHLYIQIIT